VTADLVVPTFTKNVKVGQPPDWSPDHQTLIPLADFFNVNNKRDFTYISTDKLYTYFQNHAQDDPNWVPTGPDDDSEVD
jgi:hypothetical protein